MTVLKNLIEHQNDLTYLSRIAKETGLSHSIVSKVIKPLVMSGIVVEKPLGKLYPNFPAEHGKRGNKVDNRFLQQNQPNSRISLNIIPNACYIRVLYQL